MQFWQPYSAAQHTVVGDLRVYHDLYSPQLGNRRDISVWLPPGYEDSTQRYPVVYMHDGLNLFDCFVSFSGEWQVDETMTLLAGEGLAAIVVALPNMGEQRALEYCPYPFRDLNGNRVEGRGEAYLRFIVETVRPLIDASFRTRREASATGIAGSSMGGLISLHGFLVHPDVFGLCGAFSTAYWFGDNALVQAVRRLADGHGRVYMDVGTREGDTLNRWLGESDENDAAYVRGVRELRDALTGKGYRQGENLFYVEDEGARHHESAWAARLPAAMRFLLEQTWSLK